jgi:hypothetical protein
MSLRKKAAIKGLHKKLAAAPEQRWVVAIPLHRNLFPQRHQTFDWAFIAL